MTISRVQRRLGKYPHTVYRCYDAEGLLLYIGCTINPQKRMREHRAEFHLWTMLVDRVVVEVYPDRLRALDAEREAIRAELPEWNGVRYRTRATVENSPVEPLDRYVLTMPWEVAA